VQAAIAAPIVRQRGRKKPTGCQIVRLYDVLERLQPSPIVSLNRAVAIAMVDSPQAAIRLWINLPPNSTAITCSTPPVPILLRSEPQSAQSYRRALELVNNDSERRFLERRLREVQP